MKRGASSKKNIAERCPSCERAVEGLGWVCPYCGEDLRGRVEMWLRYHAPMGALVVAAIPVAIWGGALLSVLPFGVWTVAECARRKGFRSLFPWLVGGAFVGIWSLVDRVILWDAWVLWNRHGIHAGLLFLALYRFLQDPMEGGVDDIGRWAWGRIRLAAWALDGLLLLSAWGLMRG